MGYRTRHSVRHPGLSPDGAVRNKAAPNSSVQAFIWMELSISLGWPPSRYYYWVIGHVDSSEIVEWNPIATRAHGCPCSERYVVVSHCALYLEANDVGRLFMYSFVIPVFLLVKCLFMSFAHFTDGLLAFLSYPWVLRVLCVSYIWIHGLLKCLWFFTLFILLTVNSVKRNL